MIFYRTTNADGLVQLAPTQADAKAIDKGFQQHDVPTDKAGLMAYINELLTKVHGFETALRSEAHQNQVLSADRAPPIVPMEPAAAPPPPAAPAPTVNFERVQDWIFDHATAAQVENLFTALGTRFHEMRKALGQ